MKNKNIKQRLEELREAIENENISWGEIAELYELREHIDKEDILLLEWAGVPEFEDETDENLIEDKEEIIEQLTKGKGNTLDGIISRLLEIERELTLRETN